MRIIDLDFYADKDNAIFLGYAGEHLSTVLNFHMPAELGNNDCIYVINFLKDGESSSNIVSHFAYKTKFNTNIVEYYIPSSIMGNNTSSGVFQLVAYGMTTTIGNEAKYSILGKSTEFHYVIDNAITTDTSNLTIELSESESLTLQDLIEAISRLGNIETQFNELDGLTNALGTFIEKGEIAYTLDSTTMNVTYNAANPKIIYTNAYINNKNAFVFTTANNYYQIALCYDGTEYKRELTAGGSTTYKPWVLVNNENTGNKKTTLTGNESSNDFYPTTKAVADALNTKADSSALTAKADVTYVDNRLNTKADVTYVDNRAEEVGDLKSALNGTVDLIGDTTIYNVSLAESGTGVGANWNHYYDISLPKGTKLNFYLSAYTGVLFTDVLVRFYDTTNTLRSLTPSVMQTGKLQTYTLFEDCTRIWVQINRSATENGVSAQFIMSFDTSGLSADVAKIRSVLPINSEEVLRSVILKYPNLRFKNDNSGGTETAGSDSWVVSDYIPVGLGLTVTGYSYSRTRPGIVEYSASKKTLGSVAGNDEYVTRTYTPPTKVAYVRLQTLASKQDTKATSIINSEPKVYRVEKNGSGDFTKLVDAINEAVRYMDSTVYVGAGTWDLIDELGEDYINSVSSTQRGLYLKNRIHVICSSNSKITCNYTGSRSDTITWLSAFNAGPLGFTLENATIESSNCRYAIHDERDQDADEYNNYYINCKIKHDNTNGGYNQCIGGGLGLNGHVIIDGCIFENPARTNYQIVYYHNSAGSGKSFVEVKGSYFKGTNTLGFMWYGTSPANQKSTLFAHDNSLGSEIQHTGASGATVENTEVISFNNEIRP